MEYDCEIIHRPGVRMTHVDALSRAPANPEKVLRVEEVDDDWLLTMQLRDPSIRDIAELLKSENDSAQTKQLRKEYSLQHNRVYRRVGEKLLYVVPKAVRWRVARYCHDDFGHFGIDKTIERILQHFWFPKMRKYVKEYVMSCVDCCYNKTKGGKSEGVLYTEPTEPIPFRLLHIDHLGPFIKSKRGNTHVLAISDAFTKYLVVKPVRSTKTLPVIQALNEVSGYFGLPARVVTDRGTAFTSKQFIKYCRDNNFVHIKTAVRTPRANGQVERANQTILNYLRTTTSNPKEWDEQLRKLQWSINSQKNSTTGFSPNELIFDFKLTDITHNHLIAAVIDDDQNQPIQEKREAAWSSINEHRDRWKVRFDKKHKAPTVYNVDDLVVILNEPSATGESRKLEPKFRGPYVVAKVLGKDRYLLTDIDGMQISQRKFESIYAADKMKHWCDMPPELDDASDSDYSNDDDENEATGIGTMPTSGRAELSPDMATPATTEEGEDTKGN